MITKSQAKRKQDIKTKLMAAIAMLLVSSIMMVSSTYAWFTLSTAPEVTGINTAVGANGNLEMALVPTDGGLIGITSSQGDSAQDWTIKNLTWGNLVDVSDASYGLDKIQLYPSALNLAEGTDNTLGAALLKTPTYGADGRVDSLSANTTTSTYDTTSGTFSNDDAHAEKFGVRAVGAASGMTDRQLAYRNYRSAASTAMVQAQNAASASLKQNGQGLANIVIKHAMNSANTHTQAEINSLRAIVTDLLGDGADKIGALQYIEKAYVNYILAYAASAANSTMDDTTYLTMAGNLENKTLSEVVAEMNSKGIDVNSIPGISEISATIAKAQAADTTLDTLTGENVAWEDVREAMINLVNPEYLMINGKFKAYEAKQHVSELVAAVQSGITLNVMPGSGVYADIADHCGDYKAGVVLENLEYNGIIVETLNATMATESEQDSSYIAAYAKTVETAGAPEGGNGQSMPITETYGYVVDLAFRTNAAASDLLLQTEAKDRIYNGEGSDEVMGHGSTMTFVSENAAFGTEQVKGLMKAIRIVFFRGTTVLANAKLDMASAVPDASGTGVTAPIKLYTKTAGSTTYREITGEEVGTHISDGADGFRPITGSETGTHVEVTVPAGETFLAQADAIITALTQNTPETVSVLVYLDGEHITNADVATAGQSATGTMNLQFSSTAQLDPMDYTPLMAQGDAPAGGGENQG